MLCTPITYVGRGSTGEGLRVNAFEGSAKLAGKLLWAEDDPRTHLCLCIDSDKTETLQENMEVMKRTFGQALTRSSGAQLDNGKFNSIFTLFPADLNLLRFFCRRSGVHIYCTHEDVLPASRPFLSIHTNSTAGPRNIMLPGKYRVTELFSKRIIGDNISQFSDHLPAGTTVLYSLESVR